ncbi:MAG: polysaccharide deacetylase family protein [Dehalococcoidia bacterium]
MCCERTLLSFTGSRRPPRPRILCYHSVGTPEWGVNDVSPAQFRSHIEVALAEGYTFAPAAEVARRRAGAPVLAITFDDGLASVAQAAAPILAEYGIPWSIYIVSSWADGQHPEFSPLSLTWHGIERLAAAGATIGSHSATHPNFAALSRDQALAELVESRELIHARTGIEPREFAIPFGQSGDWDGDLSVLARRAGYDLVYAQSEARRPPGTVPRTFITRFDGVRTFRAALRGAFDRWEEWR